MKHERPLTLALGIAILAMLALTVLPAQQSDVVTPRVAATTLSTLDYIEIQQLVRKSAWALDSGDNYGYAFADLFTPDGVFVGASQGSDSRTFQGRDQLATIARGGSRGATVQSHFTMNHVIRPGGSGVTGRAYVVVVDVGVAGQPNRVKHGGSYDDVYEKTPLGWRFKQRTYRESKVDTWPGSL